VEINDRQQRLGYLGAAAAVIAFTVVFTVGLPAKTGALHYGVGLVLAAFMAYTVYRRKAVAVALGSYAVSFGPWGNLQLVAAAYLAAGGLLLFKASKEAGQAKAAVRAEARAERLAAKQAKRAARRPGAAEATTTTGRKPPPPSKRYTPPKR
jgi:hypothetical protein